MRQYSGVFTRNQQTSASGNTTPPNWTGAIYVTELLIVGGGGSGGGGLNISGGGGAGGALLGSNFYLPLGTYTVTVGAGGSASGNASNNGADSAFGSFVAKGGGYGGSFGANGVPGNGGCGGGISFDYRNMNAPYSYVSGTYGGATNGSTYSSLPTQMAPNRNFIAFGNSGGLYGVINALSPTGGGGIGGAGGGANFETSAVGVGPNGGPGLYFTTSGSSVAYGGGGAGASSYTVGAGGVGGVGGGGNYTNNTTTASGAANTGGGGGGSDYVASQSGSGGSGVVILKYRDIYPAASATTGSPSITVSGGFRYYRWTGSGSITFS